MMNTLKKRGVKRINSKKQVEKEWKETTKKKLKERLIKKIPKERKLQRDHLVQYVNFKF